MSFYIPFICDCQSNADMYGALVDNREHQSNCIRYRILARNYFHPAQKWWRSSPFFSKSKLNSGARVLVENGHLLPAWRYSLLANEREKWMRDFWLQICRNLFYSLQSEEYVLPSTKENAEDTSYCFVNGVCTTLRSKNLQGLQNMSMLAGFQVPRKLINSQFVNTPLGEHFSNISQKNGVTTLQFLEARNIFRCLIDGSILREILIYQGTTTSIPHVEMEQWMRILFAEEEILVEKPQSASDIYWPVEAVNLFSRRQDIMEHLRGQSEDDLISLREIARDIEKLTVQEIKSGDALIDVHLFEKEWTKTMTCLAKLQEQDSNGAKNQEDLILYCIEHVFSVQHLNSLQGQVYISSCFSLLSKIHIQNVSETLRSKIQELARFMESLSAVWNPYLSSLQWMLQKNEDLSKMFSFLLQPNVAKETIWQEPCGIAWDVTYSHQEQSEEVMEVPLSIQLDMGMGVLDFSQDELDTGMKKIPVGSFWELPLSNQSPIRILGERPNEISNEYYLILRDDFNYKVEFKKQMISLSEKKNTDYIVPLEKGSWKISFEKQQLRFRIR